MEKLLIESVIVHLGMMENVSFWALQEMVTVDFDNSTHSCDLDLIRLDHLSYDIRVNLNPHF
jgi:metal-sulfur cluster biosynthetic enzyme